MSQAVIEPETTAPAGQRAWQNGFVTPDAPALPLTPYGRRAAFLIPPALLVLLPLFPPETRGESMAGCGLLLAIWALALGGRVPVALPAWLPGAALLVGTSLALLADAPGAAVEPVVILLSALAVGCCAAALRPGVDLERIWLPLLAAVAVLVACHALYQRLWGLDLLVRKLDAGPALAELDLIRERALRGRAFAAFPTPAALGGFLALSLPPTIGAAVATTGRRRLALAAAAVVQAAGFMAAASATAIVALVGAVVFLLLVDGRTRRWAVVAVLAGAALLGSLALLRDDGVYDPADPENPFRLRAGNYRIAAAIARDNPWLGVGPGGYAEAYPRYRRSGDNESRHVHDLPLEAAAELGIPLGALLSAAFFAVFVGPLWSRRRRGAVESGLAVGLATFAIHNLGDFTAYLPSLLWLAALLRGAIHRGPPRESRWFGLGWIPLLACLSLLAACAGLADNCRDLARHARAQSDPRAADRLSARAVGLAPWHVDGWLLRGAVTLDAGRTSEAAAAVAGAIAGSPVRPGARALRARVRFAAGDVPGAWADAAMAARLYPLREGYARERDELWSRLPDASGARR